MIINKSSTLQAADQTNYISAGFKHVAKPYPLMPATVEIYIGKICFKTNERKERKRKDQGEVAGNVFVLGFGDVLFH